MRTVGALDQTFSAVVINGNAAASFEEFLNATISESFPELAVVAELEVLSEAKREVVARRWLDLVHRIAAVTAAGVKRGQLRPLNPIIIARSLLALATWAPLQRRLLPAQPTSAVLSGARQILFRGLAADRSALPHARRDAGIVQTIPIDLFDRASVATAKREKLLGVASGLFNRRGVGATRIEEIAEAVGLNKRAIFRQFGSKDQLVAACFERANEIHLRIAEEAAAGRDKRVDVLHEAIRRVVLSLGDDLIPALTSHVGLGRLAHGTQIEMQERFAILERAYRDLLCQGMEEGSIRSVPVNDVVAALAGNLNWVASTDLSELPIPLDRIATELADLAVFGVLE